MRDREFDIWLTHVYKTAQGHPLDRRSIDARISNCRHVEEYLGDLDAHWRLDRMEGLLRKFVYDRNEEFRGIAPRHGIPIDGDQYNGTATLKSALTLYGKFCRACPTTPGSRT